jgi:hypothetical protein
MCRWAAQNGSKGIECEGRSDGLQWNNFNKRFFADLVEMGHSEIDNMAISLGCFSFHVGRGLKLLAWSSQLSPTCEWV